MKKDIHPEYIDTQVTCTCGSTFTTRSYVLDFGLMIAEGPSQEVLRRPEVRAAYLGDLEPAP